MDDQRKRSARPLNANLLLRKLHGYGALLTAPTLVFFALTGALQVLGLHEAHGGAQPSPVIAALGRLHKHQVLVNSGKPRAPSPARAPELHGAEAGAARADGDHPHAEPKPATTLLKAFTIATALILTATTCLGVWIGLQDRRRRATHLVLLGIGVAVPLALVIALR